VLNVIDSLLTKKTQLMYALGGVVLLGGSLVAAWRYVGGSSGDAAGKGTLQQETPAQLEGVAAERREGVAAMIKHVNSTVVQQAEDYFYPAKSMVATTARMLNKHTSIRTDPYFEQYVYDVLKSYPQLDNFYIADSTGSRVMASRRDAATVETDIIDRSGEEKFRVLKRWNQVGQTAVERHTEKQLVANPLLGGLNVTKDGIYDSRQRPWYQKAIKERDICWSDVYIFNVSREPGITVAAPALGSRDDPLFVVAADFEIKHISKFLGQLDVGGGIAFIINGNEELIAYPEVEKVLSFEGGRPVLAKAASVVPDWARMALEAHRDNKEPMFLLTVSGRRYIASFAPFLESFGNDWRIVVVAPEEDLVGGGAAPK
jgi:hypothetical protein